MPRILHMTNEGAIILCEFVPNMQKKGEEVKLMEQVEITYCRPQCGYYRDASIRGPNFKFSCINPNNPLLPHLKKQLGIAP